MTSANNSTPQPTLTLGAVMRRPRWIAALVATLIVAGGFAALAQWQLGSAIQEQALTEEESELPVKLIDLTEPGQPVSDKAAGQIVVVQGRWVPEDFTVVANRVNQGEVGYWVVGHLVTAQTPSAHLAVALGWSATPAQAERVAEQLAAQAPEDLLEKQLLGRYTPTEKAQLPGATDPVNDVTAMSIAQQANLWQPFQGGVYGGFLVSHENPAGLDRIDSFPPLPQDTINWLNLFYAIEWMVFAGFAFYFWYRIVKDAWLKELDAQAEGDPEAAEDLNEGK